jgi:tetratricopeptide (TPR) repeat protein
MTSATAFRALAAGWALALAACSSYTPPPSAGQPAGPGRPGAPTTVTAPAPVPPPPEPAVSAHRELMLRAERAAAGGDYEQALALLERAQRIDPDDADVYLRLARTHGAAGNAAMARASAERGLLYCRGYDQCQSLRALAQ